MRIFVTGAAGWIGSSVVPELIRAGHHVLGLARSDASAELINRAGASVVRGDLADVELLRESARHADGVVHLAYEHALGQAGGAAADAAAIDAFITALAGTGKPLVVSGATLTRPGGVATEHDQLVPTGPIAARITNLQTALGAADRGIRVSIVMLPRSVHGAGERHGFIPRLVDRARDTGISAYVGDGSPRWPAVHVQDAAVLYRLALEKAAAGAVLHAVGDEGVHVRDIAEAIGRHLGLPAEPRPVAELGMPLGALLSTDMPASSEITQKLLGWTPVRPGLLDDIEAGHYFQ